jgi:hypothetical protein
MSAGLRAAEILAAVAVAWLLVGPQQRAAQWRRCPPQGRACRRLSGLTTWWWLNEGLRVTSVTSWTTAMTR